MKLNQKGKDPMNSDNPIEAVTGIAENFSDNISVLFSKKYIEHNFVKSLIVAIVAAIASYQAIAMLTLHKAKNLVEDGAELALADIFVDFAGTNPLLKLVGVAAISFSDVGNWLSDLLTADPNDATKLAVDKKILFAVIVGGIAFVYMYVKPVREMDAEELSTEYGYVPSQAGIYGLTWSNAGNAAKSIVLGAAGVVATSIGSVALLAYALKEVVYSAGTATASLKEGTTDTYLVTLASGTLITDVRTKANLVTKLDSNTITKYLAPTFLGIRDAEISLVNMVLPIPDIKIEAAVPAAG